MSKLYIDDMRRPPDTSWDLVHDVTEAIVYVSTNGCPDEISFDVYKTVEPLFDSVIDLKICHVVGYGRFEISISKTCEETTVKSVNGISLETELAQSYLYEIHVNDDEYLERAANKDIYIEDFDANENLIPIVFYNPSDPRHSLLHLLISEKASQWGYKYVTPNITEVNLGKKKSIASDKFQRTFTFDGTDILSAMSEVSQECNVIFSFDTEKREINVYDRFTLGEDTTVLVNRRNFASSIQIDDLKDEVKNCFRVSGGDDIITNYFSAVNITGNYIYDLNYQEEDMPTALSSAIHSYLDYKETLTEDYYGGYEVYDLLAGQPGLSAIPFYMGEKSTAPTPIQIGCYYYNTTTGKYYIWNGTEWLVAGAFVRYCAANDTLSYYQHVMAPTVGLVTTTAQAQAQAVKSALETITTDYKGVAVSVTVSSSDFAIATNNVLSYAKVIVDSRYTIKNIVEGNTVPSYSGSRWNGKLQFYRTSDETDNYTISVSVPIILADKNHPEYQLQFAKQKIMKSLASNSTYDVDEYIVQITQGLDVDDARFKQRIVNYLSEYNLTELKTFYDAFQSCLNILDTYYNSGTATQSALFETIYKSYKIRVEAANEVIKVRQKQVDEYEGYVTQYSQEIATMQKNADFKTYLDNISADLWILFNSYRREDTYQNDNYISDGLNDGQILAKCKELLDAAQYNLSIACTLQHTLSVSINNLLIMPEFREFWNKFAIFNYIRVQEDDLVEPYKLQLIQADFNFDSPDEISVTFATNILGSGNVLNSLESVVTQSISIGSSFSSVTQQATHGDSAKSQVSDWMNEGLNMAATQVKNANNEEVTVNNYGILLRSETDEGQYDPFQVKLTGQGLYYTKDNWDTVLGCLGKITLDGVETSGLIAKAIVGELIAGQSLKITNSSGSVVIDGNTAKFTNIGIDYTDSSGRYVKIGKYDSTGNIFRIGKGTTDQLKFNTSTNKLELTGDISASSISGSSISGGTITGGAITGGTINGTSISGVTITGSVFKNTSDTFSIDSYGNVKGSSITGSTLKTNYTAENGFQTLVDPNGIYFFSQDISSDEDNYFFDSKIGGITITTSEDAGTVNPYYGASAYDCLQLYIENRSSSLCLGVTKSFGSTEYSIYYILNNYTNPYITYDDDYTDYRIVTGAINVRHIFYGNLYFTGSLYTNTTLYNEINDGTKSSSDEYSNGEYYPNTRGIYSNARTVSCAYTGRKASICLRDPDYLPANQSFAVRRTSQMIIFQVHDESTFERNVGTPWVGSRNFYVSYDGDTYSTGFQRLFGVWGDGYIKTLYTDNGTITGSDRRKKNSISELDKDESARFIYSLKPSEYKYNNGSSNRFHHGLIAQEVKESMGNKDWGVYIDDGEILDDETGGLSLRYEELIADLIATVQSLNERIKILEEK